MENKNDSSNKRWAVTGGGLIILLTAAILLFFPNLLGANTVINPPIPTAINMPPSNSGQGLAPSLAAGMSTPTLSPSAEAGRPNPHVGPTDAPITIVEFGDFACPSCRTWAQAGMRQILANKYGGKIRIVWADFPVITLDSPKAAEAGRCAYDQNKFWEYQDYVYNQNAGISVAAMKTYATAVGLDRTVFDKCLDSGIRTKEVLNDWNDAIMRQVTGTPTFFVNEQRLVGLTTPAMFYAVIDPILAKLP